MPPSEEVATWLAMARTDLRAVYGMIGDAEAFSDEVFGFHAQQAVEKTLKGWLTFLGREFPKIHDIEELLRLVKDAGVDVPEEFLTLVDLADFAVQYRYELFDDETGLDRILIADRVNNLVACIERIVGLSWIRNRFSGGRGTRPHKPA